MILFGLASAVGVVIFYFVFALVTYARDPTMGGLTSTMSSGSVAWRSRCSYFNVPNTKHDDISSWLTVNLSSEEYF